MRRRFGRGRRGRADDSNRRPAIDAKSRFDEIVEAGTTGAVGLSPIDPQGVPGHVAVVAEGADADGRPLLVGFSPDSGGDAALAVAAAAQRQARNGFAGDVIAVAPQWSIAARRRLAWLKTTSGPLRAVAASAPGQVGIISEASDGSGSLSPRYPDLRSADPEARDCFERAARSLEGLAAKHAGCVRRVDGSLELVVLAARTARLRFEPGSTSGVILDVIEPERSTDSLASDKIATVMDRLEGHIRKRANDRRVKNGEIGLRASLLPSLLRTLELRDSVAWPFSGGAAEIIDVAGLDGEGRATACVVRERLDFESVGQILDTLASSLGSWTLLFEHAARPLRADLPRLVIVARDVDDVALDALEAVTLDQLHFGLQRQHSGVPDLVPRPVATGTGASLESATESREEDAAADAGDGARRESTQSTERIHREDARRSPDESAEAPTETTSQSSRSRHRNSSRGRRGSRAGASRAEARTDDPPETTTPQSFEEISAFDLDDEGTRDSETAGTSPTRRRRRRRRRRSPQSQDENTEELSTDENNQDDASELLEASEPVTSEADDLDLGDETDDLEDPSDTLMPIPAEVPDPEQIVEPVYEEDLTEGSDSPLALEETEKSERSRPRGRVAIVVEADRGSVLAGVLLGRELRLMEGFWVYPQSDLMTFFRSVATDLPESTPIHVVGFVASPSRDVLQAAALYADRLDWYDHHEWPPEDLDQLKETIGADRVHVHPGMPSSLPMILADCTRRSRFSDKLVELQTGRFSDHDYERWGRLWWHRLGELATRPGECRADLLPLFAGRPSDLARESSLVPAPSLPPEVSFASSRDFRLVHFGGYLLVIVPTPPDLDCNLAARIVRERYEAAISLAYHEGEQTLILSGDDSRSQRGLNLKRVVDSVADKHNWVEALPDDDHLACMRVSGLDSEPERLEELIRDIAMARSVFEA